MGIKTLTIYDVPKETRALGAAAARRQIQQQLNNSFLTLDQRKDLQAQLRWASKWESLRVAEALPSPVAGGTPAIQGELREPTHHSVELVEDLSIEEH